MLKAIGKIGKHDILLFGLTNEDERRMRHKDQPIVFSLRSLSPELPDIDVLIFRGATQADLKGMVASAITSETKERYKP